MLLYFLAAGVELSYRSRLGDSPVSIYTAQVRRVVAAVSASPAGRPERSLQRVWLQSLPASICIDI